MATELLRDKLANVDNQLKSAKLQLFLTEIQAAYADDEPTDADEFTKAAYVNLKNESSGAKANAIALRRKIAVLQPIFDGLEKEAKSEEASATNKLPKA